MPTYKLTYFDTPGKGEAIRYLLSLLGEDFEDKRLKREEWPSIKPTTPFGKVPILEIDGKLVTQSTAICRYLGKKAKLAGDDEWEDLQIDMIVETYHDLRQAGINYATEKNEETKVKKLEILLNETFPFYFGKLDEIVKKNDGYLANGKLSWGDVYFIASAITIKNVVGYDYAEKFPNLQRLEDNVLSLPQVKKWKESQATV